jgi:hypothetical protein
VLYTIHKDVALVLDIDRYLDTLVVNWDSKDDLEWILQWWKANTLEFPIISRIARDYLAIPLSEIDVERLFSSGRDLIGIQRHYLKAETMKALIFIRNRYRGGVK